MWKLAWGRRPWLWATAVLLLMFALTLTSMAQLAPTFDEQGFLVRGLGYLRGQNRQIRVGHPLGLNALNALPLWRDTAVKLPLDHPSWEETSFHRPAERFLWEIGNNVEYIMFLSRLPTIWLAMLLATVVGRWAWNLSFSQGAGLLALALIALDPNMMASARLTTTDVGVAFAATFAGFTLWRFLKRPSWRNAIIAGIGFGLLQNTKFTAGLFVPLFAFVILTGLLVQWQDNRQTPNSHFWQAFPWRNLLMLLTAYPLAAFFSLWAAYGFQIGTLPQELPAFAQLGGLTIPLSHHVEQLLDLGGRLQVETPSFLMGQYSNTGWWYYFPVAFLLKTPLPILLLLGIAFLFRFAFYVKSRWSTRKPLRHDFFDDAALLIPALGYFAFALTSEINLGYRHLLPILPFLAVFSANSLKNGIPIIFSAKVRHSPHVMQFITVILIGILLIISLWIYPHYLSYFNILAGGPNNGWRFLVDSNIDWGQDLNKVKRWMDENDVDQIWLSYFGEARPDYYNINYIGLDSWPPRLMNPQARPYYPPKPAPGIYAISVTNLQGVHFTNHDQFAYFRERDPMAKIGYSIFLYEVPASGERVDLLLAGIQLDQIDAEDFERFNSNHIQPHWFDVETALIVPDSKQGWLVLAKDTAVSPQVADIIDSWPKQNINDDYLFYQVQDPPTRNSDPLAVFRAPEGEIELLTIEIDRAVPGQTLRIKTSWRQNGHPQPLKLFIHVVDEAGNIIAQWDGLGAAWEGWRSGDLLLLSHNIPLPDSLPAGEYTVRTGIYQPETGARWQTAAGSDFLELGSVQIDD